MQELQPLQAPVLCLHLRMLNINSSNFFSNSNKHNNSFTNNSNIHSNNSNSNSNNSFCSSKFLLLDLSFRLQIF
ncbi:hypothetical protein CLOP_g13181 [Closterium sp. NIES-67]|nr:hypothetical protein CLOP_g13181 [Closterium sp. NIES-67]